MKVLHIVGDSKFGGGSILIINLARKAIDIGFKVYVLTTDETFRNELRYNKIKEIYLDCIRRSINPIKDIIGLYRLFKFLKKSDYMIVHTHTSKAGFVGRLAAHLAKMPIIIHTVHGFAFHEQSCSLEIYFYSFLERLASHWCDAIVCVSEFHKKWALRLGIANENKIFAINNGIAENRILATKHRNEVLKELNLLDEPIILFMGRLAPQKGLEYLLESIPIISSKINIPFKLLIVGEGPLRAYLDDLVEKLNIRQYVIFLGFRKDIGNLLNISDMVVLPSLREGLSIALLEAMAAGKPIITTTIGSNLEVVKNEKSALLVPPKNSESLAEAVIKLINNPDFARKIGHEAKKVYKEKYTEDIMLNKHMELYLTLVQNKGKITEILPKNGTRE